MTLPAPYYTDEHVTLYLGDCEEILPEIRGVDLAVTSPPYNLGVSPDSHFAEHKPGRKRGSQGLWGGLAADGIGYADHADDMPHEEYRAWQRRILAALWDTLSDKGAIFYNHKPRIQATTLWLPLDMNPDLPLRQIIIWSRGIGMNFNLTNYLPTHEWICVFAKPAWRLKSRGASGVGDVWNIRPDLDNPEHPAAFPLGLPARAIETAAPSLVLDPFAGSGTTLRAAKDAGVRVIGIEKSERYCEVAARRLAQDALDFGEAS